MDSSKLLFLTGLNAWYTKNRPVLSDLSLELGTNEVVGLIGLNGAGKTTFIRMLSGLHDGFSVKSALWRGEAFHFRDRYFKKERYAVFAEDRSFPYFTFREYLSYVSASYGRKPLDADDLIRGFHFEEYTDILLKELSTGNRRKAYLITAFALRPPLLLLDEPINGLDFQSTEYLYERIGRYRQSGTVLFSSHILESVCLTADRVLVLEQGKIVRTFAGADIRPDTIREALKE